MNMVFAALFMMLGSGLVGGACAASFFGDSSHGVKLVIAALPFLIVSLILAIVEWRRRKKKKTKQKPPV